MGLIPVFSIFLFYQEFLWSLIFFLIAGITDGLDGLIARRFSQTSSLGTILDPIADKLLMTTAFIALTFITFNQPVKHLPIPFWVTAVVIGRDILIVAVAMAINFGTGFRGFKPSFLGKLSTMVQVTAVGLILLAAVFPSLQGFYLPTLYTVTALITVVSGVQYIFHVSRLMSAEQKESSDSF
jgi:cardiolipin synthase